MRTISIISKTKKLYRNEEAVGAITLDCQLKNIKKLENWVGQKYCYAYNMFLLFLKPTKGGL